MCGKWSVDPCSLAKTLLVYIIIAVRVSVRQLLRVVDMCTYVRTYVSVTLKNVN